MANIVDVLEERLKQYLEEQEYKLYDLIWKRTVASQMTPAQNKNYTLNIVMSNETSFFMFPLKPRSMVFPFSSEILGFIEKAGLIILISEILFRYSLRLCYTRRCKYNGLNLINRYSK